MNFLEVITKKRDGQTLTKEELEFIVESVTKKTVKDYQISALLMAIYFKGMSDEEIAIFTNAIAKSGHMLHFDVHPIVDKHSSGGVGDKTTLVIAPVVAACGLPVAKLSGRGLGFTGGTIDKLESIPGFKTEISQEDFDKFVKRDGISVMGQSSEIAPCDKVLYALRDVTATVDSIPLIASSIMSKKLADGSDAIVLDVKCGTGAFMKDLDSATELAEKMVKIGEMNNRKTIALVTDMNQPLGEAVGNRLEVIEAINTLKGKGPKDFVHECKALSSAMLQAGNIATSEEEANKMFDSVIASGKAYDKLKTMVRNQGGNLDIFENIDNYDKAPIIKQIKSSKCGYISKFDTEKIGMAAVLLGAGRLTKEDEIDPRVGFVFKIKLGDYVDTNTILFEIHANSEDSLNKATKEVLDAIETSKNKPEILENPVLKVIKYE